MRLLPVMLAMPVLALTVLSACQNHPPPPERPKRVPTPGTASLPPTPNLNPPQAPDRYPDGAWSVRGIFTADKAKLSVPDPVSKQIPSLQLRGTVASLHPCPLTEKVCRPAPYLELSDNKTGQGRRILVGGERDLDARRDANQKPWTVGAEITVTGRFATSSPDGMYFAPDGLILLDPLPPPADADAIATPDAR